MEEPQIARKRIQATLDKPVSEGSQFYPPAAQSFHHDQEPGKKI